MNSTTNFPWTDDQIEDLKRLWSDGKSATEIAKFLGNGLTRSAVLGKVHRLKLKKRMVEAPRSNVKQNIAAEKPKRRQGNPGQKKSFHIAPSQPIPEVEDDLQDVTHLIGILELTEQTCKFPIGDPKTSDFGFCGAESVEGKPYCEFHCRRAYRGVSIGYEEER